MQSITVFTAPGCYVCKAVMSSLTKKGVPFTTEQLADHPEIQERAKEQGFASLPVVTITKEDGTEDLFAGPTSCSEKIKTLV